jgi:hypothetical protein
MMTLCFASPNKLNLHSLRRSLFVIRWINDHIAYLASQPAKWGLDMK